MSLKDAIMVVKNVDYKQATLIIEDMLTQIYEYGANPEELIKGLGLEIDYLFELLTEL